MFCINKRFDLLGFMIVLKTLREDFSLHQRFQVTNFSKKPGVEGTFLNSQNHILWLTVQLWRRKMKIKQVKHFTIFLTGLTGHHILWLTVQI